MSLEFELGVLASDQESAFMNATLQPAPGGIAFSVAVYVDVPAEWTGEEAVAEYLRGLLSELAGRPNVQVQVQIGPEDRD